MALRLLSIWLCAGASLWISFFTWFASLFVRTLVEGFLRGRPLPNLSNWFLPTDFNGSFPWPTWPYYFPLLIVAGAAVVTWKGRKDADLVLLFCVGAFALTACFLAAFLPAMILPFATVKTVLHH